MIKKETLFKAVKSAFSLLLILTIIAGCGSETATKKKKKVIKKVVVVQKNESDDATSSDDSSDYESDISDIIDTDSGSADHDDTTDREKRPLAEKEEEAAKEKYVPEYKVTVADWNGPKGYVIVYAKGSRAGKAAAVKLQSYFKKNAGVTLSITDDSAAEVSKEILVGESNRVDVKLKDNEYSVILSGQKLCLTGGHFATTETAVDWFVSMKYTAGKVNLLDGKTDDFTATVKDGYKYVWGDEFAGGVLDDVKWCFKDRMAGTNLMPCLRDENVVNVNEGMLKLTAVRYYNASRPAAQYATNSSVCTEDTFSYKYGYIEMRARVPFNRGAWPSFWMVSNRALGNVKDANTKYTVEVDVFEVFSSKSTLVPNIHKWYTDGTWHQYQSYNGGSTPYSFLDYMDLSNEYHTYGFEWTPEKMIMSVDGVDYMTYDLNNNFDGRDDMEGFHKNLMIILNNFIYVPDLGSTNASNQVNNTDLPFEYFIDYIRLYQKPGVGALNFAD